VKRNNQIAAEMIDDLKNSTIEWVGGACDAGINSQSIYYFDKEIEMYRRILLKVTGDDYMFNTIYSAIKIVKCLL